MKCMASSEALILPIQEQESALSPDPSQVVRRSFEDDSLEEDEETQ